MKLPLLIIMGVKLNYIAGHITITVEVKGPLVIVTIFSN